jgi:hypothetical protein
MKTATRMLIAIATVTTLCAAPVWPQTQEARAAASVKKGLTWKWLSKNSTTGTVDVGCWNGCDAYNGDTPCTKALPLLCIKKTGPGFPLPVPASVVESQYHKWAGGVIGTTKPVVPPSTRAAANALCVKEFGPGFRVAEHHDGWGWHFQAYGGVGNPAQNFWVDINDQPGATCW